METSVIVMLNANQAEHLKTLAEHCGISPERMAQVFVADGIASYMTQQNELKGTLAEDYQP